MLLLKEKPDALQIHTPLPSRLEEYREYEPSVCQYECTSSMQYLRQYFFIREYAYKTDLQLKEFSGAEDDIDQYSHFIIARRGHFVVAGARLTISTLGNRKPLPLESDGFSAEEVMPELKQLNYCELGRTAVLPDYRKGDDLINVFKVSAETALRFDCKYLLGASPPSVARRFKQVFNSLGYPTIIHPTITPPVKEIHEHLRLQFLVINLQPTTHEGIL